MSNDELRMYLEKKFQAEEYTLSSFASIVDKTEQIVINWIEIGKKKKGNCAITLSAAKLPNYVITRESVVKFFVELNL